MDETRALARFELWFMPLLLVGPVVMLGISAGISPQGRRYKPVWYLLAILFFCTAPGMLVDAASTSFAAVDRADGLTQVEQFAADLKPACGAVAAIGAPAGLAYLAHRRGRGTYMKAWATCSIVSAILVLVMFLPGI